MRRPLLPLVVLLAGCPPWISRDRHEQSLCKGGDGNLVANGSFDRDLDCWGAAPEEAWQLDRDWSGLYGPPSALGTNPVLDNATYDVNLISTVFPIEAGHRYGLGFEATATESRRIWVFVQECCEVNVQHLFVEVYLDQGFREYWFEFAATTSTEETYVDFQVGEFSTAPVWIDGVRLEDLDGSSQVEPPSDLNR